MGIEDLTQDELLAELDKLFVDLVPPPGAFTVYEIAERYHMSREVARNQIYNQVDAGKLREWGKYKGKKYYVLVTP